MRTTTSCEFFVFVLVVELVVVASQLHLVWIVFYISVVVAGSRCSLLFTSFVLIHYITLHQHLRTQIASLIVLWLWLWHCVTATR